MILVTDLSKDTYYMKVDQLPPFNITMMFCNENGFASFRRLLGVRFVTDGVVYSIQDMLTEQTLTYFAEDFTPLIPLTLSSLFQPAEPGPALLSPASPPREITGEDRGLKPQKLAIHAGVRTLFAGQLDWFWMVGQVGVSKDCVGSA